MRVLEAVEIRCEWSDMLQVPLHPHPQLTDGERAEDLPHAASLIRSIAVKTNMVTNEDRDDEMPLRILIGMGWEYYAAQLYPDMVWQPGEIAVGGIALNMDGYHHQSGEYLNGLVVLDEAPTVDEFKYTAKSMRKKGGGPDELKDIRAEWSWMSQTKAYCYALADMIGQPVLHAQMHVCWAMGNYTRHTLDERYFRYLVEFTPAEIKSNWDMLLKEANGGG